MSDNLYHYTCPKSFIKIKTAQYLYFFHVKKFIKSKYGDKTEIMHGLNILIELMVDFYERKKITDIGREELKKGLWRSLDPESIYRTSVGSKEGGIWVVACFTDSDDNNYLREKYSNNNNTRICIPAKLLSEFGKILKVSYLENSAEVDSEKRNEAEEIAEEYLWTLDSDNKKDRDNWDKRFFNFLNLLLNFIFSIKGRKYEREKETRIIKLVVTPKSKFRKGFRYYTFSLNKKGIVFKND